MNEINFDQFQQLDIRIGTVVKAEVPEWSHWVMKLTVDFGSPPAGGGERTIFSGIMKFYKPEDLVGKQYPFVINLKPKRIGPANEDGEYEYSQGMMLMSEGSLEVSPDDPARSASSTADAGGEETAPIMLHPAGKVPNGVKVH